MKKKRFALFLFTLCLLCLMSALPAVAKAKTAPKKITLSREKIVLYKGESKKLIVEKTKPASASPKVTWTSKNKKVADVSKYGRITAKKPGRTIITAVSKKDPSVRAKVQMIVKKAPAKTEKEYPISGVGLVSDEDCELVDFYRNTYACQSGMDGVIVRSRDGFNEMKKLWNKNSRDLPFRKTAMAEYGNIDFSKESLIILRPRSSLSGPGHGVTSISVKFNASGKLEGIIDVHSTAPIYPHNPNDATTCISESAAVRPAVPAPYPLYFRIKKGDESMIDCFRIREESVVYDNFIIFP